MEEDPTPIPTTGLRKSLIMNDKGVVTGEEMGEDLGHTASGYVPFTMPSLEMGYKFKIMVNACAGMPGCFVDSALATHVPRVRTDLLVRCR